MAPLANKFVLLAVSAVVLLSLGGGSGSGGAYAMGLPPPPPTVNFSIGVQGVVWCRSCKYDGYYPPMDASPLPGAAVTLRCKHGRHAVAFPGRSGPGGYFVFVIQTGETTKVQAFTSRQCRVYVQRSPRSACGVPYYPAAHRGLPLKFQEFVKRDNGLQAMYSVGNFLFRPKNPRKCY